MLDLHWLLQSTLALASSDHACPGTPHSIRIVLCLHDPRCADVHALQPCVVPYFAMSDLSTYKVRTHCPCATLCLGGGEGAASFTRLSGMSLFFFFVEAATTILAIRTNQQYSTSCLVGIVSYTFQLRYLPRSCQ